MGLFKLLRWLIGAIIAPGGSALPTPSPTPDPTPAPSPTSASFVGLPPAADQPRRVGAAGIALIKRFEGCARRRTDGRFAAYADPGTGGAP